MADTKISELPAVATPAVTQYFPVVDGSTTKRLTITQAFSVLAAVGLLMLTEDGQPASRTPHGWLALVFEAVSAFGTVGLSAGVTPLLTDGSKLVLIVLMFVGRVGPLVLAVYLARPANPLRVRNAREEVALG